MRQLLTLLGLLVLGIALLTAIGIGIGYLVHWLLPAIDLGSAALMGTITSSVVIVMFFRFMSLLDKVNEDLFVEDLIETLREQRETPPSAYPEGPIVEVGPIASEKQRSPSSRSRKRKS
jgi:hypothetical protein